MSKYQIIYADQGGVMVDPTSDEERAKLSRLGLLGNKVITVFMEENCSKEEALTCLEEVFKHISGYEEPKVESDIEL